MEMKIGAVTHGDAQKANNAHYDANSQIMDHVNKMTLAGKQKLIETMADHCKAAEAAAKA